MIKMIFATGPNGEFGCSDGLPWNVPSDMIHFKAYTKDCIVIMNSATFQSLPFKLPGRINLVISSYTDVHAKNGDLPDININSDAPLQGICEAMLKSNPTGNLCIIGGRKFLEEASMFVEEASVSYVHMDLITKEADFFINDDVIVQNLSDRLGDPVKVVDEGNFKVFVWDGLENGF